MQPRCAEPLEHPEHPEGPERLAHPEGFEGPEPPLSVTRIVVGSGRLTCDVRLAPATGRFTTPALARKVQACFPLIAQHACVNERGATFGAVIQSTPVPHLLEHLIIDLQTQAAKSDDAAFVGTTEWLDQAAGTARVQVSFTDDLVALQAINQAVDFLNECIVLP